MIEIRLNGEHRRVNEGLELPELVAQETGTTSREGLAVARNGEIVPKSQWDQVTVAAGDEYEIAAPFQGG